PTAPRRSCAAWSSPGTGPSPAPSTCTAGWSSKRRCAATPPPDASPPPSAKTRLDGAGRPAVLRCRGPAVAGHRRPLGGGAAMNHRRLITLVAVASLAVASCGDDDDDSGVTTGTDAAPETAAG